LFEIKLSQD